MEQNNVIPKSMLVIKENKRIRIKNERKERITSLYNGKIKMMNPHYQNYGHIKAIKNVLNKGREHTFISLITFTKRCTLKIGEDIRHISSDEMVIYDFYLSETINRKISIAKLQSDASLYSDKDIESIHSTIYASNITDPEKRHEHNRMIQSEVKDRSLKTNTANQVDTCD